MPVRNSLPNARLPKFIAGAASVVLQLALVAGALLASPPPEECKPLNVTIIYDPGDPEYGLSWPPDNCHHPLRQHPLGKLGPMGSPPRSLQFVAAWTKPDDVEGGICRLPPYPGAAKRQHIEGTVDLLLTVDGDGRVTDAMLNWSSGDAQLDAAALSAARKCHYRKSSDRAFVAGRWELRYEFTRTHSGLYQPHFVTEFLFRSDGSPL